MGIPARLSGYIDLDFLPIARQIIKDYAVKKYVHVCSVGNWNTYNPKQALQDAYRAHGGNVHEITNITTKLPNEFDELTLEDHDKFLTNLNNKDEAVRQLAHVEISKYQQFYDFRNTHKEIVDIAYKMVGKIKSQGTHAGGLIIADRPISELVPLSLIKSEESKNWTSQWTEGGTPQLSKFGLVKFDILGLKTMQYIWQAGNHIKKTKGITIDWSEMNPKADPPFIGHEISADGTKKIILLNDPLSLKMCNDLKTQSVFQIETDIQKGIISDGKVKSFWDLVAYNALGRPGPIAQIEFYIANRDDPSKKWKNGVDKRIITILESTHGIITFQEQLTRLWIQLAGFTVPEAEAARKIVAKKWTEKLSQIEKQWKEGAYKTIGKEEADKLWLLQTTFGRYAFNLSHSIAYSIITYMCLYLKAHYPAEWWASVLSLCHQEKTSGYMGAARLDGVKFGSLDINILEPEHAVHGDSVTPGLGSIKGIGKKANVQFTNIKGPFSDIDDMVQKCGKSKTVFERLIKLGAFDKLHPNRRGLWKWYLYKYCSGKDVAEVKKEINNRIWPVNKIKQEQERQIEHFKLLYPNRKKIPNKILNFKPKINPSREEVINMFNDFEQSEKLLNEKQLLGFYWTSPLTMYKHDGYDIEKSKKHGVMEVVVEELIEKKSQKGNIYYILRVTDGIQSVPITIWKGIVEASDRRCFSEGIGVKIYVSYDLNRKSFKIAKDTHVIPLLMVNEDNEDEKIISKIQENYPLW